MNWASYHNLARKSDAPLFIFGDHAYKFIPPELNKLGLSGDDLTRHIAWDIGSAALVENISRHFGNSAHMAALSRLVVDMNREPERDDVITRISDGTFIPGNDKLSAAQRAERLNLHEQYHQRLSHMIEAEQARGSFIVSLHSFCPHPKTGPARNVQIGLMHKADEQSALQIQAHLGELAPHYVVGLNEPYSAHEYNYSMDRHVVPRGLRHIIFEIRQDLLSDADRIVDMSELLIKVLTRLI